MFKSSNKIISAYGITILSTVVGTVCGLSMTILMGYPLFRRDLPGRNGLAFYVFFTMLFSGGLVPTYIMYTRYHQGEQHDLGAHHSVPYGQRILRDHDAHVLLHEHSGGCY